MKWSEFKALISGLNADTPLGRIIQIRSETNPDIIKDFTPGQKRIHDEWQKRMAESVTEDQMNQFLDEMKRFFVAAGS